MIGKRAEEEVEEDRIRNCTNCFTIFVLYASERLANNKNE